MLRRINILMTGLVIVAVLFYLCAFEVSQGDMAVGSGNKLYPPGLQFKWPWQKVGYLNVNHQMVEVSAAGTNWTIVAEITDPRAYLQNNGGKTLADLVKQAWTGSATALQQNSDLTKNGIVVNSVILSRVTVSDADQATIIQTMQGLSSQIAQNILNAGEAQAQDIRAVAETNFLATQKQALDLSASVTGQSQAAAVKLLAPFYQKNPALFKAYMQAKSQILFKSNS